MNQSNSQLRISSAEFRRQFNHREKDPYKVYQGKRNKENGTEFERYLSTACQKYSEDMTADISKANEPLRIIGKLNESNKRPTYKCVITGKSDPDYKGMLNTGRAVGFEAKHTDTDQIERREVTQHQAKLLERYSQMNAVTFVMVSFGLNRFFRVPWHVWQDMKKLYGRQYLKAEDIPDFEVPVVLHEGKPAVLFLEGIDN